MTKLPRVSSRECITALEKVGFIAVRQKGSHVVMRRSEPYARTVVPINKEVPPGTLRSILRDAQLTVDDFVALL